jgi:hypothetical protein
LRALHCSPAAIGQRALHHLARHILGTFAKLAQRLALLLEGRITSTLAERAGRSFHRLAGFAERFRLIELLIAESFHHLVELVVQLFLALPEAFRTAVILRDVEDFTYEEIARILSVPISTVMSRIHRGRALLRQTLAGSRP